MNNSKIALDSFTLEEVDNSALLKEKEATLIRIIEAIDGLRKSVEWSTLKREIFTSRIESLERGLKNLSEANTLTDSEIYRIQGRLFEARKYDLDKLRETYLLELSGLRKLTQPTER